MTPTALIDRVADVLCRRLVPTVRFPQTPEPVSPPQTGPAVAPPAAAVAPPTPAGEGHTTAAERTDVPFAAYIGLARLQPCCAAMPPEHGEGCRLVAQVTDRHGPRYVSPLGATRERAVTCQRCADPNVWALDGICDRCALDSRTRTLAHLDEPAREAMLR